MGRPEDAEWLRAFAGRLACQVRAPAGGQVPAPAASLAALDLPPFESDALVTILNETATDSGLVLDEMSYSLDDNINLPYSRYRVTMTLNANYPLIRRLSEQRRRHMWLVHMGRRGMF